MREAASTSRLMVLMFTDIVGSTDLKRKHGDTDVAKMIARHDEIFRYTVGAFPLAQILKDVGDGFLARFNSASDAVHAALHFQNALANEKWAYPIKSRVGLHLGEVSELEKEPTSGQAKLSGLAVDIAARVMSLALPGQILMTRAAFDNARQYVREHQTSDGATPSVTRKWMAHGRYMFKGADEPLEIFEVGEIGIAPLSVPPNTEKAKRAVAADQEETLGWRPAVGLEIPDRKGWMLDRKLGEGGFGEVWLGESVKTKTPRVFKFCFDAERLRSFKRELVLFRLLRDALGDRNDIAKLYEVQVDSPPFYLESEFTEEGSLVEWAAAKGGIDKVPIATRLDLVARTAVAVAAAHSVGVLHKDIKPSNILIYRGTDGEPLPRLTDFGIGVLTDMSQLANRNITMVDMSPELVDGNESSRTGTRMYSPPEALVGKPFTMQGDVFSLGILLYQMVVGDLDRPLAQGWEREVTDPLLREDITRCVEGHESDRLASAKELADRINSLPARRRARVRRKIARLSLVSTIALAVLSTVFVGVALRENMLRKIAVTERNNATIERDNARAMSDFLLKMVGSVEPRKGEGRDAKVADLLDKNIGEIDTSFADKPEIAANLRGVIGRAYKNLGIYPEAKSLLESALAYRRQVSSEPNKILAQNLEDLAAVFWFQADMAHAKPLYEESLAMRIKLFGEEHVDVASSINHLAACLSEMKEDPAVVEGMLRKSLEMRKRLLLTPEHPFHQDVAASMSNLALIILGQGQSRYAEAEKLCRDSLTMVKSAVQATYHHLDHIDVANAYNSLAIVLSVKGDEGAMKESLEHFVTSEAIKRKVVGDDNPQVAATLKPKADLLTKMGQLDEAERSYDEALKIRRAKLGAKHRLTAVTAQAFGQMLVNAGKLTDAEPVLREAVGIRHETDRNLLPDSQLWLGWCLTLMERFPEAEPVLVEAHSGFKSTRGDADRKTIDATKRLAEFYDKWGKIDKANEYRKLLPDSTVNTAVRSP